jgi:hypothetical protein
MGPTCPRGRSLPPSSPLPLLGFRYWVSLIAAARQGNIVPMGFTEFYLIEGGLGFGLLVSLGIGVLTFRHPAYRFARICSWAGAALFVSIAIVWGATTKESAKVWIPTVAFIGAVGAVGLTGALRAINSAELQLAQSDKAAQTSNGAPNFNFQGPSTNTFNLSREPQQQTENAAREEIYQAGISVGKVFGGRRSPTNATIFEFQEITQAGQFNLGAEFEYQIMFLNRSISRL